MDFQTFLRYHRAQLESTKVPELFWPAVYKIVTEEIFNAGNYFTIEKLEFDSDENSGANNGGTQSTNGGPMEDLDEYDNVYENCEYQVVVNCDQLDSECWENIFLVDHMWTFELKNRKNVLLENEHLTYRLCDIMNIRPEKLTVDQKVELIDRNLFKYCESYCVNVGSGINNLKTFWYVMDEFGSRIGQSWNPSFRCVPFTYIPKGIAYSLFYPLRTLNRGELVTRSYCDSLQADSVDQDLLSAMTIPWKNTDLTHLDHEQVENDISFSFKFSLEQMLPNSSLSCAKDPHPQTKLKVYSQYKYVNEYLTDNNFELCESRDDADILWLYEPFYEYNKLSLTKPDTFVNQFPYESILTLKDLFAVVCRRIRNPSKTLDDFSPFWLMPTYDLQGELTKFVSLFQKRAEQGLDNHWIVKPWNLSRGLETVITDNLCEIIKLRNALPKVVSKYIERPVLFRREDINANVKFDLRFIVLLKSVAPLDLLIYKKFWIRFANVEFSLDELDNYEKHFTVMNYEHDDVQWKQMTCDEFIVQFNCQHGKNKWSQVEKDIHDALKEVFICSTMRQPPAGIAQCGQSRSVYGIDVMLRWDKDRTSEDMLDVIRPTVLEVNWMPDCKRACEYYPNFFNDIFNVLFLNKSSDSIHQL